MDAHTLAIVASTLVYGAACYLAGYGHKSAEVFKRSEKVRAALEQARQELAALRKDLHHILESRTDDLK